MDQRGRLATASYADHVRELIEQLPFTRPGERSNRPAFGTPIPTSVFDAPSEDVLTTLQYTLMPSLQQFLAEIISVEQVEVTTVDNKVEIRVSYVILSLDQRFEQAFTP